MTDHHPDCQLVGDHDGSCVVVLGCADCGKSYYSFPLDVVLPDDQWLAIFGRAGGVLCADCIVARGAKLPGVTVAKLHFPDLPAPVSEPAASGEGLPEWKCNCCYHTFNATDDEWAKAFGRLAPACPLCSAGSQYTYPVGLAAKIDKLEHMGFECAGGPLKGCKEWQELRAYAIEARRLTTTGQGGVEAVDRAVRSGRRFYFQHNPPNTLLAQVFNDILLANGTHEADLEAHQRREDAARQPPFGQQQEGQG